MPCCNSQPFMRTVTSSGTMLDQLPANMQKTGMHSYSVANVGGVDGLLGGETLPAGATATFESPPGRRLGADMTYDASGTTFLIAITP